MKNLIMMITLATIFVGCGSQSKKSYVRLDAKTVLQQDKDIRHDIEMERVYKAVRKMDFARAVSLLNQIKTDDNQVIKYQVRSLSHDGGLWKTQFKRGVIRHFITNLQGVYEEMIQACGDYEQINKLDTSNANLDKLYEMSSCLRNAYRSIDTERADHLTNPIFNRCLVDKRLKLLQEVHLVRHNSWCAPLAVTTFRTSNNRLLMNSAGGMLSWVKAWSHDIAIKLDRTRKDLRRKRWDKK